MSNRFKELREHKHLTLQQLSDQTGISVSSLSAYEKNKGEKGYRSPKLENLDKLARYFHVSLAYLRGETNVKYGSIKVHYPKEVLDYWEKEYETSLNKKSSETMLSFNELLNKKASKDLKATIQSHFVSFYDFQKEVIKKSSWDIIAEDVSQITWLLYKIFIASDHFQLKERTEVSYDLDSILSKTIVELGDYINKTKKQEKKSGSDKDT